MGSFLIDRAVQALKSGLWYILRGDRGQAIIPASFLAVSVVVGTTIAVGELSFIPFGDLNLSQRAGISALAAMIFVPVMVETIEPFLALVPLRRTVATRHMVGIQARSVLLARLLAISLLVALPVLAMTVGSLTNRVGSPPEVSVATVLLSILFFVLQVLRRYRILSDRRPSDVSEEITGGDALRVAIEGYAVSVMFGAMMALVHWLIDGPTLPAILGGALASGVIGAGSVLTFYMWWKLPDAA